MTVPQHLKTVIILALATVIAIAGECIESIYHRKDGNFLVEACKKVAIDNFCLSTVLLSKIISKFQLSNL